MVMIQRCTILHLDCGHVTFDSDSVQERGRVARGLGYFDLCLHHLLYLRILKSKKSRAPLSGE